MNRKKNDDNINQLQKPMILELQNSLLTIKKSHQSNELIVNKFQKAIQNEQQNKLYSTLQKDSVLINNQLATLLDHLKTIKSPD